jgi:hypothetical protein
MPTTSASRSHYLRCWTDALTFSSFVLTKGALHLNTISRKPPIDFRMLAMILEESEFRKQYPRQAPRNEEDVEEESEGEEDPSEVFDKGGRFPVIW